MTYGSFLAIKNAPRKSARVPLCFLPSYGKVLKRAPDHREPSATSCGVCDLSRWRTGVLVYQTSEQGCHLHHCRRELEHEGRATAKRAEADLGPPMCSYVSVRDLEIQVLTTQFLAFGFHSLFNVRLSTPGFVHSVSVQRERMPSCVHTQTDRSADLTALHCTASPCSAPPYPHPTDSSPSGSSVHLSWSACSPQPVANVCPRLRVPSSYPALSTARSVGPRNTSRQLLIRNCSRLVIWSSLVVGGCALIVSCVEAFAEACSLHFFFAKQRSLD